MSRPFDLVCLSHLRWDFVYQRPQHLLSRCAGERRVYFVEEPIIAEGWARLDVSQPSANVWVVRPHLPEGLVHEQQEAIQRALLSGFFIGHGIEHYVLWYYTPMALGFTRHLSPLATVYDCMDELSLFAGAPPLLRERERELLRRADLVFTGGQSLYQAKRTQHHNVHAFPSSVDRAHFAQARTALDEPTDQRQVPRPRLGYYGVIDERIDLDLVGEVARLRPDWQLVLVGPVVKIDAEQLPRRSNIHYLGIKGYTDLPSYLASWDVAIMPFAHNDATRFISPTKTLEYLAAGKPVVSTSITDVATPYGKQGLVQLADTAEDFVAAAERAMSEQQEARLPAVDAMLAGTSWQQTWERMRALIEAEVARHERTPLPLGLATAKERLEPLGVAVKGGSKVAAGSALGFPAFAAVPTLISVTRKELE